MCCFRSRHQCQFPPRINPPCPGLERSRRSPGHRAIRRNSPRRAAIRTAILSTTLPVYEAATPQTGRGRAEGLRALEAYALYLAHAYRSDLLTEYVHGEMQRALAAGCEDPFIRYASAEVGIELTDSDEGWETVIREAEKEGLARYPAVRRMHVYFNAALFCPTRQHPAQRTPATGHTIDRHVLEGLC